MFNLDSLSFRDTTDLQLRHPVTDEPLFDGNPEDGKIVGIALYGTSSKQYRTAITAMQNRQLRRQKQKVNAETLREESVKLLVACSAHGINLDGPGGIALDNEDAFNALYSDPKLAWVKEQVDAALGDPANFLAL
jgi:hypothetical protein